MKKLAVVCHVAIIQKNDSNGSTSSLKENSLPVKSLTLCFQLDRCTGLSQKEPEKQSHLVQNRCQFARQCYSKGCNRHEGCAEFSCNEHYCDSRFAGVQVQKKVTFFFHLHLQYCRINYVTKHSNSVRVDRRRVLYNAI